MPRHKSKNKSINKYKNDKKSHEDLSYVRLSEIDYKNVPLLKKFLSRRYKILPKKVTRLSSKKQRKLKVEIKKARIMGLLPFTDRHSLG